MKPLVNAAIVASALILSSTALAQETEEKASAKGAIVVELEPPKISDVKQGRTSDGSTFYQVGDKRTSSQRGIDATKFCNSIRYKFGSVLEIGTLQTGDSAFDYLKRVICFE